MSNTEEIDGIEYSVFESPSYGGRLYYVPKDAKPGLPEPRKSICPVDKFSRGVGLSSTETDEFSGICELGAVQVVACYGTMNDPWRENYTANDFASACRRCKYWIAKADRRAPSLYDPYILSGSMFNGRAMFERFERYIDTENPKGFVYFISDGEYIKIGKAAQPWKRMYGLQTGNPKELKIMWLVPCAGEEESVNVEQTIHRLYRNYRLVGEWFDVMNKIQKDSFDTFFSTRPYEYLKT